ncbi:MAG TPA: proteasome assembly chaperone family protein [Euryarchaeota archaeon]|nr:proteasome assembly chaperone family protein [Euryarchaeota archaeon]
MDDFIIVRHNKPQLKEPVLIEGLPGVGNVGKLAADHMVDELETVHIASIYSKHLPPQVLIDEDGIIRLVSNELHGYKNPNKNGQDLLIVTGDYQGMNHDGQYDISHKILDMAEEFGVSCVYTLGGYHVNQLIEIPKVLGAATKTEKVEEMKSFGVVFSKNEPGNGIVGASGLLLGLSKIRNIPAACLMGETYGYFVGDPNGAKAVLEILVKILGVSVDFSSLEKKAKELEYLTRRLKDLESVAQDDSRDREHLEYIG